MVLRKHVTIGAEIRHGKRAKSTYAIAVKKVSHCG
jgi:hypothetical protein